MNKTWGSVIGGGIVAVVIIAIIAAFAIGDSSISSDKPEISESAMLDEGGQGDSVAINESYSVEKGGEIIENEEGEPTYIIKAGDSPEFGE